MAISKTQQTRETLLEKILLIIRENPGIRASEISRKLHREHSWDLRSTLIERGLIKKERDGAAVRYYPIPRKGD